ncbi:MAG: pyruvate/2-oxoglutarate dehydrogenase complex dihydrolipoamide dehydrogenase (E3) component [Mariniblastus sp.]|jgi:pyruvate/2-oxoglutarate dehydrogenase complex dihydrolipoamide dehydrogenase (E3) component
MSDQPIVQLLPYDQHNRDLEANVHPTDWKNPEPQSDYQLVVIGAGTAGLVTAAGAAGLGARVALIERELMGGDCLNVGCVPSKGLIGAARVAATVRDAAPFGVNVESASFDFGKTMERMRAKRAHISPADSAQRFSDLGVDVFFGQGSFVDHETVTVTRSDGSVSKLKFKKAVIAAGARASAPPIKGLDTVSYLTNENLFSLTELPPRLGIIGAGPIGSEMAQSFARFGSQVFLFERSDHILSREDHQAAAVVQQQFERDGVNMILGSQDMELSPDGDAIRITGKRGPEQTPYELTVDHLLVAVGRAPNTDGLNLESVGVKYGQPGIEVNDNLQTTNPRIFAAGDICSKYKFTHAADFQARIVIQNALFAIGPFGKKKASDLVIPWATYTSPEIAHVGLYEHEAKEKGIEIETYIQPFDHVDRAILESKEDGFVKVHTRKGTDKILGATIVAENAGDLISELTVAMNNGIGLAKIGSTIHPYPTQAEAIRRLGDQFNKTKLTPTSKKVLDFLRRLNVGK